MTLLQATVVVQIRIYGEEIVAYGLSCFSSSAAEITAAVAVVVVEAAASSRVATITAAHGLSCFCCSPAAVAPMTAVVVPIPAVNRLYAGSARSLHPFQKKGQDILWHLKNQPNLTAYAPVMKQIS